MKNNEHERAEILWEEYKEAKTNFTDAVEQAIKEHKMGQLKAMTAQRGGVKMQHFWEYIKMKTERMVEMRLRMENSLLNN